MLTTSPDKDNTAAQGIGRDRDSFAPLVRASGCVHDAVRARAGLAASPAPLVLLPLCIEVA